MADVSTSTQPPSPFKSTNGHAEYLASYGPRLWPLWPIASETIEVVGRFGRTHVLVSGPPKAPPLVLLHAYSFTLAMWAANAADLGAHYRIYVVDVMGQPGKSVPDQAITSRADYAEWLTSVLDALHLDRVWMAGMSFGGWLTLDYRDGRTGAARKNRPAISG